MAPTRLPRRLPREAMEEIVRLGELRAPREACGVLLPKDFPHRGKLILELPNRSETPERGFEFLGTDLVAVLEGWVGDCWEEVTIWHTHPGGQVGPSAVDLDHRVERAGNLVVTLGAVPKATWF